MEITVKGIRKLEKKLNPALLEKAIARGLNETARKAVAESSKATRKVYNIKARDFKKGVKTIKARQKQLVVNIKIEGESIPIEHFGAKKYLAKVKGRKEYYGVSAKIKKNERRKKYKHIFFAKGKVYRRTTKKRFPIKRVRVISAVSMFKRYGEDKIEEIFEDVFLRRVLHHYSYYINKIK